VITLLLPLPANSPPKHHPFMANTLGVWRAFLRALKSSFAEPLEPILHPSVWRMRWIGSFYFLGNFIFWWIWSYWLPQPYESLALRVVAASMGIVLIAFLTAENLESPRSKWIFGLISWFELPLFFGWMLLCNQGSYVWLPSYAAMILLYYKMTDWRLASLGLLLGLGVALVLSHIAMGMDGMEGRMHQLVAEDWMVILFAWLAGMVLSFSSANSRSFQLKNTLATMGVLAHELRTPIASVALMSDVLQDTADELSALSGGTEAAEKLTFLATRLDALVKTMSIHIDTQIANARQMPTEVSLEPLQASECVRLAITNYPFSREVFSIGVQLEVRQDFCFLGVDGWLIQLLNNLIKNALHALAQTPSPFKAGDLRIVISQSLPNGAGRIDVIDRGVGLSKEQRRQVFQPFYSTNRGASHGLGLPYCRKIADAFGGTITLQSEQGIGTTATLNLPTHLI
jgi:signal transduction histidine kinase